MKRVKFFALPLLIVAVLAVACSPYWSTGDEAACSTGELCSVVVRRHYPARHWRWSGIPLVEGGWIPDPHFLSSQEMDLPDPVRSLIGIPNAKFQVVDVNPFFDDNSSEVLLLIGSGTEVFQYSLMVPKHQKIQAVLGTPELPSARIVTYGRNLAVLEDFFGPAKGAFVLRLPLRGGVSESLISAHTSEFQKIAQSLRSSAEDDSVKRQFCRTDKGFASLWEKYVGSCGWSPDEYAANPTIHDYAYFWLRKD